MEFRVDKTITLTFRLRHTIVLNVHIYTELSECMPFNTLFCVFRHTFGVDELSDFFLVCCLAFTDHTFSRIVRRALVLKFRCDAKRSRTKRHTLLFDVTFP